MKLNCRHTKRDVAIVTLTILAMVSPALAETEAVHGGLPAPVTDADFYDNGRPSRAKVELGRALFFDKMLSGNRNISCATCHHPRHATSDGLPLPFGEGPAGLGPERQPGEDPAAAVAGRVPRNSPALFNLGAREFTRMFHDGRVETDPQGFYEGGFITPARWKLPTGLDNVLAAQAMFPVTSLVEMAGQRGENVVAEAQSLNNAAGAGGVWELISERLRAIPEYVDLFRQAFPDEVRDAADITFVRAANAIAAFETKVFRADDSPFDRYLRGDREAISKDARDGLELFYGKAGCADCHSGSFQTDHEFHAIAMPQIGPGKSDGWNDDYWQTTGIKAFPEDFGRARVTTRPEDMYKFRTPSLRNVALTGPWGHDGAYDSLEAIVRHHLAPVPALAAYEMAADYLKPLESVLELTGRGSSFQQSWLTDNRLEGFNQRDTWVQRHPELRGQIAAANELASRHLSDREIDCLLAFLDSLTDPRAADLTAEIPTRVPSGLPVVD